MVQLRFVLAQPATRLQGSSEALRREYLAQDLRFLVHVLVPGHVVQELGDLGGVLLYLLDVPLALPRVGLRAVIPSQLRPTAYALPPDSCERAGPRTIANIVSAAIRELASEELIGLALASGLLALYVLRRAVEHVAVLSATASLRIVPTWLETAARPVLRVTLRLPSPQ